MKIKKVHVYPNVTWATLKSNKKYDIAILELEDEVKLTAKVRTFSILWLDPILQVLPICLPGSSSKVIAVEFPPFQVKPTFDGEKVVIVGWGAVRQVRVQGYDFDFNIDSPTRRLENGSEIGGR